ncbi:PTS glucose transporter subunit IIA [Spiroplasma culicicola]|uniref:PTS system beta-glucoside-specific IIBC component n=1 Tax=Spiroplasma culicicola AES-1 TaxID=1276246 RepID=W6A7I9_9MOLU|nr:PTS glucose transporter subunit IIA [Spiroplasma culicicola]AHI52952.1 PTS system beta-glucoside-specific IIBC component [Spiroplasma culicicola AES-1]
MNELKLYAPIDCEVESIENLNDGVFSEKMLGDGIFLKPLKDVEEFYSVFSAGSIEQIFNTKHAFFEKSSEGPIVLVHIGLDTVTLKGSPFNYNVTEKQIVNLNSKIVDVNMREIKESNLRTETAIVFDEESFNGWKISNIKKGKVKKGDEILTLTFEGIKREITKIDFKEALEKGLDDRDRFSIIADEIYSLVGGESNYNKYYNCITRLRFDIKDKSKINENEIKKISLVKGFNWSGNELQIIFGGAVNRVREAYDKYIKIKDSGEFDLKTGGKKYLPNKKSFANKAMDMFKGIILPCLPVFLGTALITATKAILEITGVIEVVNTGSIYSNYNIFEVILFTLAYSSSSFLTIFICYSTVRYFNGNGIYGLMVGVIISAPLLFRGILQFAPGTEQAIGMGAWSYPIWQTKSFVEPNGLPVVWLKLGGMPNSLIAGIGAGYLVVKSQNFFTKIIPGNASMVLIPPSIILSVGVSMFLILGPMIGFLETFLGQMVGLLIKVPWGIDRFIFGLLWPMLVITGAHVSLLMIITLPRIMDPGNVNIAIPLLTCIFCSALGQMGVGIGLLFKSKDPKVKENIYGALPASIFGISEPMMYGVNLPNGKAFFYACFATACGSLAIGVTGGNNWPQGGNGILSIINSLGPDASVTSLLSNMFGWIVTLGVGITLSLLLVKNRADEKSIISSTNRYIRRLFTKNNIVLPQVVEKNMTALEQLMTKENKKLIKDLEQKYSKLRTLEIKISKLEIDLNSKRNVLSKKFNKLRGKKDQATLITLLEKINEIQNSTITKKYVDQANILKKEIDQLNIQYNTLLDNLTKLYELIIVDVKKPLNYEFIDEFTKMYFNGVQSMNIYFDNVKSQKVNINKKDLYNLNIQ